MNDLNHLVQQKKQGFVPESPKHKHKQVNSKKGAKKKESNLEWSQKKPPGPSSSDKGRSGFSPY